jgi:hypothetical protein
MVIYNLPTGMERPTFLVSIPRIVYIAPYNLDEVPCSHVRVEGHPDIIIIHALPYVVAAQCAREKTFLQLIELIESQLDKPISTISEGGAETIIA